MPFYRCEHFTPVVDACIATCLPCLRCYIFLARGRERRRNQSNYITEIYIKIMPELPLDVFVLEGLPETVRQFKRTFRKLRMMTVDGILDRHRPSMPALTNGELGSLNFADMRSLISVNQIYA